MEGKILPLKNVIHHDDRKPLSYWLQAQDRYMRPEARHLLQIQKENVAVTDAEQLRMFSRAGRPGFQSRKQELTLQDKIRLKIFFAAPIMFFYLLRVRGLILDGWPGWYYVMQRTLAEMLLSLRLLTEREGLVEENAETLKR